MYTPKHNLELLLVLAKEEETYFCSTQQIKTYNKHCLVFPTTIYDVHTTECVKPQQAAKNTVSANGFKLFDTSSVADRKSSLFQYHDARYRGKKCIHAPGY